MQTGELMPTNGASQGVEERMHDIFVPGRLCVIGEHTDWAAGYRHKNRTIPPGFTLVATTNEGLHARVGGRTDGRLVFKASRAAPCTTREDDGGGSAMPSLDIAMTEKALQSVIDDRGFYMYVAGTMLVVCERFGLLNKADDGKKQQRSAGSVNGAPETPRRSVSGVLLDNYKTTLPTKKGLSSSAAVCVLVVRALCLVFHLQLSVPQVMELAHRGEARAGSKCGRMDQCCALGTNHVAAMFFDGEDVQIHEVYPPECGIFLVVADLNGSKDTVKMLACLNKCFPHPEGEDEEKVHQYVRDNSELAWEAVTAVERGDAERLGRVMTKAQDNFDRCAIPICPEEFSSPLLHAVLSDLRLKELTWGIKGVGAQGDGSVQLLARGRKEQAEVTRVLKEMGEQLIVLDLTKEVPRCVGVCLYEELCKYVILVECIDALPWRLTSVLSVTVQRSSSPETTAAWSIDDAPTTAAGVTTITTALRHEGNGASCYSCMPLSLSPPPEALHPRRVRSAVIVAAGLSTRMFPASAVVKKELFPIVDHDGVCKPVILAILEGLAEAGIERFVIVVQQKDVEVFEGFFSLKAVQAHRHRLKPPQRAYCDRIEALRPKIVYAIQDQQEGFGHAVYCARHALGIQDSKANGVLKVNVKAREATTNNGDVNAETSCSPAAVTSACGADAAQPSAVGNQNNAQQNGAPWSPTTIGRNGGETSSFADGNGNGEGDEAEEDSHRDESFLLVLGDHLYRRGAGTTRTCSSQLLHAFLEHGEAGKPAIGLKVMGESSVSPYGVAAGECVGEALSETLGRWQRAAPARNPATASSCVGGRVYRLTRLVEKPTAEFARQHLVSPGLGPVEPGGEGRHLVVFGQYVLPARRTFDILAENIKEDRRERGEFQLTSVLDRMREEDKGMLGCVIHGEALDMGIPRPYVNTMASFSQPHQM